MASRFYSVDMLRGLAVALMILVNNPGSWSTVYPVLLHAPWHGLQLAERSTCHHGNRIKGNNKY